MRGLAYVGKIEEITPIAGADMIVSATIVCGAGGRWQAAVGRFDFFVGSKCEIYLQDSLLPETERFLFMKKDRYLVRMRRFKGVPSEALVMPFSVGGYWAVGDDITELMGVKKYIKQIPACLAGIMLRSFPSFIPKTEEPNFQSVPEMVKALRWKAFCSTVKYDGSSATVYKWKNHFGCCSQNMELKESENNTIWRIANQYNMRELLPEGLAIQFEVVGEGIRKNPLGIKGIEPRLFSMYNILTHQYCGIHETLIFSSRLGMPHAEVIERSCNFEFSSAEGLRKYAEGVYPNGKQREGVVIRPIEEMMVGNSRLSFKVLNLNYKG